MANWLMANASLEVNAEDGDCETVWTVKQSRLSWLLCIQSIGLAVYLWWPNQAQ